MVLVKSLNDTMISAVMVVAMPDAISAGWRVAPLPRTWPGGGSAIYMTPDASIAKRKR